ncbi:MAG: cupin domain-containing protein [Chloroflexi bacterium]|nr:cupin domain-containing protein [Chloroflexota bacterium]
MDVANRTTVGPLDLSKKNAEERKNGTFPAGDRKLWLLASGQRVQMVELQLQKGFFRPTHSHPEHESIGYVVSGRLQMMIDGKEYTLGPGDAWHHRIGVDHWTRALEDSVAVEIHSPPRPDLLPD